LAFELVVRVDDPRDAPDLAPLAPDPFDELVPPLPDFVAPDFDEPD
jgi:hypothetical protein